MSEVSADPTWNIMLGSTHRSRARLRPDHKCRTRMGGEGPSRRCYACPRPARICHAREGTTGARWGTVRGCDNAGTRTGRGCVGGWDCRTVLPRWANRRLHFHRDTPEVVRRRPRDTTTLTPMAAITPTPIADHQMKEPSTTPLHAVGLDWRTLFTGPGPEISSAQLGPSRGVTTD